MARNLCIFHSITPPPIIARAQSSVKMVSEDIAVLSWHCNAFSHVGNTSVHSDWWSPFLFVYLFIHSFSFHSDFLLKVVFIIKPWQFSSWIWGIQLCRAFVEWLKCTSVCKSAFASAGWRVFIKTIIIIMVLLCT